MSKVFLVGYMGSGKSSVGETLATQLGCKFIDLDHFIEKEYKMTIPEIFSKKGENEFRSIEHNCLKKVIDMKDVVIACGGGTPCYYGNMELMNKNGTTIYLKVSTDDLVKRLLPARDKRPLIKNKDEKELRSFVNRQLEKREDFYHQAQFVVKGKDSSVSEIAALVRESVKL